MLLTWAAPKVSQHGVADIIVAMRPFGETGMLTKWLVSRLKGKCALIHVISGSAPSAYDAMPISTIASVE